MVSHPFHQTRIFESNTRIFSKIQKRKIGRELAEIYLSLPELNNSEYLWTMGIWAQSPKSKDIARSHIGLMQEFTKILPNLQKKDIIGSPYAVYDYIPNPELCNSWEDLKEFQETLAHSGKKLILDFVPNHMAIDSPWIDLCPRVFLNRDAHYDDPTQEELDPNHFLHSSGNVYAHGRDPFFEGWTDTVQFDFSHSETLDLHREFIDKISNYCDGIRCDMAMLPLSDVFERTHKKKGLPFYWEEMIAITKKKQSNFIFIAEVYWNLETRLQALGFDYTYDKDLYDHLKNQNSDGLRYHLRSNPLYLEKSLHFLENHDEPRSNSTFFREGIIYFGVLNFLPGATLIYEGQKEGYRKRVPVQLGRLPKEEIDDLVLNSYTRMFTQLEKRNSNTLNYKDLDITIYDSGSKEDIFARAIEWENQNIEILLFNSTKYKISGRVHLTKAQLELFEEKPTFWFRDVFTNTTYSQNRDEVLKYGLYFSLDPFHGHWIIPE